MFSVVHDGKISVASIFDDIPQDWFVVDCRPLIDGPGNSEELIQSLLENGLQQLSSGGKVCFACDYGHSRSNLLAALALSHITDIELSDAIEHLKARHPESCIKAGILGSYFQAPNSLKVNCFGISGASGIIGNSLLLSLKDAGQDSIGLSRAKHGDYLENSSTIKHLIEENGFTDFVHLAYPKPFNSYRSSKQSFNHLLNLLEACTSTGCTLHYISGWVVFDGSSDEIVDELSAPKPHSLYAQTKLLQEQLITLHGMNNGLSYCIYRLPGVFASSSLEPRFLRYIADCAATSADIVIHDFVNGSAVVPLAPLSEAVKLLAGQLIAIVPDRPNLIHLSRDHYNRSIREVAEIVALKYGIKVRPSPVPRVAFNGSFVSRILPRGSPSSTTPLNATPQVINFIEELINAKRAKACSKHDLHVSA
jgi:nucleoside-diphosphate-sugar epimerase